VFDQLPAEQEIPERNLIEHPIRKYARDQFVLKFLDHDLFAAVGHWFSFAAV
jgi:hypothetical protein